MRQSWGRVLVGGVEIVVDVDCQGTRVEMVMKSKQRPWRWIKGKVAVSVDHMELRYGDARKEGDWFSWPVVARVSAPESQVFKVEFLIEGKTRAKAKMIHAIEKELNFYLVEKGEKDPWAYARYHCGTTSNFYSLVRWVFMPSRERGEQPGGPQSADWRVIEEANLQDRNLEGIPRAIALDKLEPGQAYLAVCFNHQNKRQRVVRTTADVDAIVAVGKRYPNGTWTIYSRHEDGSMKADIDLTGAKAEDHGFGTKIVDGP
jgi:hypothetical protein